MLDRRRPHWLAAAGVQLAGAAITVTVARQRLRRVEAEHEARLRLAELEHELRQERRHDARSAAAAIHGAAVAIAEGSDDLDSSTRTRIARALASEARRLLHLMDPGASEPEPAPVAPFAVRPALEAVAACRRAPGFDVAFDVPDGLVALGHPDDTAEVLANLLDNARRHAAGSPVLVRAGTELGNVVVRVEDRGPGVDPSEFTAIFSRGRRGRTGSAEGQGLGLSVSRRLMRRQGGDLWVEGRPGGGASFVFYLPGFGVSKRTGVAPATERDGAGR